MCNDMMACKFSARVFVAASFFWAANVTAQAPEHHAYLIEISPGASYHVGRATYDGPVLAATPGGVVPGSYHSSFRALAPTLDLLAGFWPAENWATGIHVGALGAAGFVAQPKIPGAPAERLGVLSVGAFVRWHASPKGFVEGRVGATTMGIEGGVDEISAPGIINDTDALTKGLWGPRGGLSAGWNVVNDGGFELGPRASFWGAHAASEHGAISLVGFHLGVGVGWM